MTSNRLYLAVEIGFTILIVAGVWTYADVNANYMIPKVPEVLQKFSDRFFFSGMLTDVWPSLRRLFAGYGAAAILGIAGGLAIGMLPRLRMLADPVLALLRTLPPVTLIPPAMLILGIGDTMMIFVIIFVCIWPILINTSDGVQEVDDTLLATARAYGLTPWERVSRVVIPAASPRIFVGLRTSLGFALLLLVASEFLTGRDGVGSFIAEAQTSYRVAEMWAGILMLSLIGYSANSIFTVIERRLIGWSRRGTPE